MPISDAAMAGAIEIGHYLIAHALAVVVRIDPSVARIAIVDRSESCDASGDGSAMVLTFDRPIDSSAVALTQRRVVTAP